MLKNVLRLIVVLSLIASPVYAAPSSGWWNWALKDDCSGVTGDGIACWDSDDNDLYIGDGSSAVKIGPTAGAGTGSMTTVKIEGVQEGGADIVTLDFDAPFGITEDPNQEINIDIADNGLDSQHYAAASVDNEHLADNAADSDEIAAGAIDLAHMSAESVDSDQYVDASIDNAHLADNAVDSDELAAGAVDLDHLNADINSMWDTIDGMAFDKPSLTIVNDSGLKLDVGELVGGGDMRFMVDGVISTLDCTTGSGVGGDARVSLTAGGGAGSPATNYIYVTDTAGTATLAASTSLPTGAFGWIGKAVVPDATTWDTTGSYGLQRYTESFSNSNRGLLSHAREKLRALGAVYISGCTSTVDINVNGGAADNVDLDIASGAIYQLHRQTWPAFTAGQLYYYGNGTTPYVQISDLNAALAESDGTSLSGKRFNLVIWGAVNYSSGLCKIYVNLPNGSYTNSTQARNDRDNTADYTVPDDMRSVAFMIARIALRHQTASSGTWTELGLYSLLGTPPGARSGGAGAVASNEFDDSQFRIFDNADPTAVIALEAGAISTATTRTLTVRDANGTVLISGDTLTGAVTATMDTDGSTATTANTTQIINTINPSGAATWGDGGDTHAINSSDWDIDATGVMTGIGNITTDGTLVSGEFPAVGNDPDVDAAGEIGRDNDDHALRGYDGSAQFVYGMKNKPLSFSVPSPNDLDNALRDALPIWTNTTGFSYIVTDWDCMSDTDDTTLNIEVETVDGVTNATVDAVEIATDGTGLYYANGGGTITAGTIADGSRIMIDFDDTDDPGVVHCTLSGYLDGDS